MDLNGTMVLSPRYRLKGDLKTALFCGLCVQEDRLPRMNVAIGVTLASTSV